MGYLNVINKPVFFLLLQVWCLLLSEPIVHLIYAYQVPERQGDAMSKMPQVFWHDKLQNFITKDSWQALQIEILQTSSFSFLLWLYSV